jgi:hypothetical protein
VRARREALTLRPPVAHSPSLCSRVRVLKWHGVGEGQSELGADFTYF